MRTELQEQAAVVRALKAARIRFFAVPNGARRSPAEQARAKQEGLTPGIPDLVIPTPVGEPCPHCGRCGPGVVLEMKREVGGRLSAHQKDWLEWFGSNGWGALVGKGAHHALEQLRALGVLR